MKSNNLQLNKPMKHLPLLLTFFLLASCQKETVSDPTTSAPPSEAAPTTDEPGFTVIDIKAEQVPGLIAIEDAPMILDIRTPAEFAAGSILGAKNINFKNETFRDEIAKLDRDMTYIVHCKSGGRSSKCISIFDELGFKNVYHMVDGFDGWLSIQQ